MPPGTGTALNILTVLAGSGLGLLLGHRLPERTRQVVTDGLGLVTLLVAALSAAAVLDPALAAAVGPSAPVLVVLGAVLLGGIAGSLAGIERRLEGLGGALQRRLTGRGRLGTPGRSGAALVTDPREDRTAAVPGPDGDPRPTPAQHASRERFVQGFLTASLVFCVGPLTVLGSLSDGLGLGIEQLALKSVLDFFASIAFAASLGIGVAASVLTLAVVQGGLTVVGLTLGDVLADSHVAALTATGGLLLVGVALRLLRLREIPVGDLLPALVLAPLLVQLVAAAR